MGEMKTIQALNEGPVTFCPSRPGHTPPLIKQKSFVVAIPPSTPLEAQAQSAHEPLP